MNITKSERLTSANNMEGWFRQYSSTIEKYIAIWTMGAPPEEYDSLSALLSTYLGVKEWEVVVSHNSTLNTGYVIPSEFSGSLLPINSKKTLRLTRFDSPKRFEEITEYGLYQVPGRLCFNAEVDRKFERSGIESVWDVPIALLTNLNFKAQKALAYNPRLLTTNIPIEKAMLSPQDESGRERVRSSILSIGQEAGVLINVSPNYLNWKETLATNPALR